MILLDASHAMFDFVEQYIAAVLEGQGTLHVYINSKLQ